MSEFFVAGGVYQDHRGNERFALLGSNGEGSPYLMIDEVGRYFTRLSQYAHLYRVEKDYSLSLVAPSVKAQEWGVKAPDKVTLRGEVLEKLRAVMS